MEKWHVRAHVLKYPSLALIVKRLANWSKTTPNFSAIHPAVPEILGVHLHVRTCRCTPTPDLWDMNRYLVSVQTTHQIWSQSAESLLSYSSATHFDILHAARDTIQTDLSNVSNPVAVISFIELIYPSMKTMWKSDVLFCRYSFSKASPDWPAADTRVYPLFEKKKLVSALRS